MNIDDILEGARLPRRTVQLCLRGDLAARYEQLARDLDTERRRGASSLAGGEHAPAIEAEMAQVAAEMRDSTVDVVMQGLPRQRYRRLMAEHPPREGEDRDRLVGFNFETFPEALVRECTVEPEMTPRRWDMLLERVTDAQYDQLTDCAVAVNRREVDVPFSPRGSGTPPNSAAE